MAIHLQISVSGPQIGRELADDPEELAYALTEMAAWDGAELGAQVAEMMPFGKAAEVAAFLRWMAEAIEKGGDM